MWSFLLNNWWQLLVVAVVGYLLGSVNWAIIVTHSFSRKDIRNEGSGNAGATNVLRSQGVVPAILTSLGDVAKSALAALAGGWLLGVLGSAVVLGPSLVGNPANGWLTEDALRMIGGYVGGLACIIGHTAPVFYGFRGGKGVLSTLGMFLVLDYRVALICLGIFIIIVLLSRMVSLGSVLAIGFGPVLVPVFTALVDKKPAPWVVFCTLCAVIVETIIVVKHKENLKRIAAGTERKIGEKA